MLAEGARVIELSLVHQAPVDRHVACPVGAEDGLIAAALEDGDPVVVGGRLWIKGLVFGRILVGVNILHVVDVAERHVRVGLARTHGVRGVIDTALRTDRVVIENANGSLEALGYELEVLLEVEVGVQLGLPGLAETDVVNDDERVHRVVGVVVVGSPPSIRPPRDEEVRREEVSRGPHPLVGAGSRSLVVPVGVLA